MKKIIIYFLLINTFNGYSQLIKDFPTDEKGNVNFNEVVEVENAAKNDLYLNSVQYFANEFKSANDVVQMKDQESAMIIGKGFTNIFISVMGTQSKIHLWFTIKIQSKEGRYKYQIYDLYYEAADAQLMGTIVPFSNWFDESNYYKRNGKVRTVNEQYKEKTLMEVENLKASIKSAMKKSNSTIDSESSDDW